MTHKEFRMFLNNVQQSTGDTCEVKHQGSNNYNTIINWEIVKVAKTRATCKRFLTNKYSELL